MVVDVQVLGPVEFWWEGRSLDLGAAKQRCVFAVLAVGAEKPHPVEALIDRVRGEHPPAQVRSAVYSYISRLRRLLRDTGFAVRQRSGGYLLELRRDRVDLHRFEAVVDAARAVDDVEARAAMLRDGLGVWRGSPLQRTAR
ncbi:hypothetical protein Lesp02_03400 [Lentzea sp. NBRC 105346]|uniref:AfsR/SARP family transcriptional regulator n=1 Tax=Lentzea sp. NBRC 105346 TaxID=3032205 RepID=UPI0024A26C9F|nr:winged helix-turn-helix domain-containing protein [Lentzea sp. NBRC 105346]GLZ28150.1 hypothetical protein Lesp02_03400 [Lentzea sp. NBRC 105346]